MPSMLWAHALFSLALLSASEVLAVGRLSNQPICDFYALKRYGENNSTTQLHLMQSIVALAYAGGSDLQPPVVDNPGIFNPGKYQGRDVYLRPWFDGSKATTNHYGQAVGIDWLDGGGTAPLIAFLNGSTTMAEIRRGSNQHILFSRWYYTFAKIYSCSHASEFQEKGFTPPSPAYIHKYMDLNYAQIGFFIEQLVGASRHFGFSEADAGTLSTAMLNRYNNQCSPPVHGQLFSICFAKDCPSAFPVAQCEAYNDISAASPTGSESSMVPTVPASPATSAAASPTAAGASSSSLSGGAIAGISIGSAAVALLALGMCLLFRRQKQAKRASMPPPETASAPAFAYASQAPETSTIRDSEYSRGPHDSYIVSPQGSPPPAWVPSKTLHELGGDTPVTAPYRAETPRNVELEGPESLAGQDQRNEHWRPTY